MLAGNRLPGWTAVFLVTTVLTTVTGFLFPFTQVLPSHIVGAISLVVLPLALVALYGKGLAGSWRGVYVIGSIFALYLNVFVLVVQAFLKIPLLNRLAPTGVRATVRDRPARRPGPLHLAGRPGHAALPSGGGAGRLAPSPGGETWKSLRRPGPRPRAEKDLIRQ